MKIIKRKLTEYVLLASFFTILFIIHSSNTFAAGEVLSPKGYIETPAPNATLKGVNVVKGWFLDGSGVSKVEVLVDGKLSGQAQYGLSRTDVAKVFPAYKNANAGYQYSLNTANLSNGQHTLTVRETGKTGVKTELKGVFNVQNQMVPVVNLPVRAALDAPKNGAVVNGSTTVRGWFLDSSGVSKIEVWVDGKLSGQAQYGLPRADVAKAYPAYKNANAGYQYTLNTANLSNGQHTLTVRETGKAGVKTELKGVFNVQNQTVPVVNLPVRAALDAPKNGAVVNGSTTVRGWFLDSSGVSKVEVLIDGKLNGQAQYGLLRADVAKAYPAYKNANAGYQYTLNTVNLSNGQHTLTVRETGKNGAMTELKVVITVQNLPVRGALETPKNGAVVTDSTTVSGWFLDANGVDKVEVLVDGNLIGQAQYGLPRPSVAKTYPAYNNANAGYQYTLNTKSFTEGQHTLTVRETGKSGTKTELKSQFTVQGVPFKGALEAPMNGTTVKGNTVVSGWLLDSSGVSKVEVLVDGNVIDEADYGLPRKDIQTSYPEYQNANSGYQYNLNTQQFKDGQHTIAIKETGTNGETHTISTMVTVGNGNLYAVLDLKTPANLTASEIYAYLNAKNPSSPLKNYAVYFINAQNNYGVNALYLVAHTIWETGWGGSDLLTYKHNLYGYGAFDVCPFTCGYYYPSVEDSINDVAYKVRHNYLDSSGAYYSSTYGPTLTGMNQSYATDPNWKDGIASIMEDIKEYDSSYYWNHAELGVTGSPPPSYGRDIPSGNPYPTDTILNFPTGISASVNTSSVNFRSLPYLSTSTIISSLPLNTAVTVLGYNTDVYYDPTSGTYQAYHWYRVNVNGKQGWLNGQNIDIANLLQVDSNVTNLNVRSSASTNSTIMTTLDSETYLKAVMSNGMPITQNGWYQVYLPNATTLGWVTGDYVSQIIH
ncbi:Ig-like domain-containing protein [Neobacillus cucumis]|uniref:Ig-like domain-containing protein n=1 Tax=Neobacillus cucumis TaxID=1740721 RepID=UPI001965965D|nr:Ig-like domain-containing protein [Neobacillus cucumis]MBM7654748.1 beta-N-acetylglucosaminidase [Neobacillus cucumis]